MKCMHYFVLLATNGTALGDLHFKTASKTEYPASLNPPVSDPSEDASAQDNGGYCGHVAVDVLDGRSVRRFQRWSHASAVVDSRIFIFGGFDLSFVISLLFIC